ncbi:MAG: hypothetical protein C0506_07945 [Anaerolinea sp.]|nr:hypothetical protein [Anaerolinea sp.]
MKISYDKEVDALSIIFAETTVTTKHLAEGIAADFDRDGRLVGLEILDASSRLGSDETFRTLEVAGVG